MAIPTAASSGRFGSFDGTIVGEVVVDHRDRSGWGVRVLRTALVLVVFALVAVAALKVAAGVFQVVLMTFVIPAIVLYILFRAFVPKRKDPADKRRFEGAGELLKSAFSGVGRLIGAAIGERVEDQSTELRLFRVQLPSGETRECRMAGLPRNGSFRRGDDVIVHGVRFKGVVRVSSLEVKHANTRVRGRHPVGYVAVVAAQVAVGLVVLVVIAGMLR